MSRKNKVVNEQNGFQPAQCNSNVFGVLTIFVNSDKSFVTKGFELLFEEQRDKFFMSMACPYSTVQVSRLKDLVRTYNQKMWSCDKIYMESVVSLLSDYREVKQSMLDPNIKELGVVLIMDVVSMVTQVTVYPFDEWQQKYLDVRSSTAYSINIFN